MKWMLEKDKDLPHARMFIDLPHTMMSIDLPHTMMSIDLPHTMMYIDLPHTMMFIDLPRTMMSIFFKAIGVQNDDKDEVYIENMKNIMSELKFDVNLTDDEIIDKIKKEYEKRLKSGE